MSKLIVVGENRELARKVQVDIVTTSDPNPAALRFARLCIQQHQDVAEAFSEGTLDKEYLGAALCRYFPEDELCHVGQVVQYLVDEHEQIGGDGVIMLLNPTTGKAMARLTSEDFYVPAPVPREDGTMVKRTLQVKPELLGLITQYQHDKGRDDSLQETMLSRIPTLLPEVAKRQTLFVTQRGRKEVASLIHERLGGIIEGAWGIAKALFDDFPRVAEPLPDGPWGRDFELTAESKVGVQDLLSRNLKFDPVSGATASIATGWARLIGVELLSYATTFGDSLWASEEELSQEGLYISGPETSKKILGQTLVCSAPEGIAVYLTGPVGNLYLRDYETQYREVHEKWTLKCTALGTLYVDWSRVRMYRVEGIDTDPPVEIV
jgi:hypothetical protein